MRDIAVILAVVLIAGGAIYYFGVRNGEEATPADFKQIVVNDVSQEVAEETEEAVFVEQKNDKETVIGTSVEGNAITAYHFLSAQADGNGSTELLFIGGIHGGYGWSTSLVAYELMDYLEENPDVIPENVKVTVIPVLNPDGLNKVVGTTERFAKADAPSSESARVPGRFNGNSVDLNRNFDCDWRSTGTWRNTAVDGGSEPFSEPESKALRDYVKERELGAVVAWYSAAGGVFSSSCDDGVSSETRAITNLYADASGYPAFEEFDFYEITGDMVNWLASIDIPAISVLLTTHTDTEWDKNKAGIEALFTRYAE